MFSPNYPEEDQSYAFTHTYIKAYDFHEYIDVIEGRNI